RAAVGPGPGLQGRLRAAARLHAGAGADRAAVRRRGRVHGQAPAAWLPVGGAGGRGGVPAAGGPALLALGHLAGPGLFDPGTADDPAPGAVPVPVGDPGTAAPAHAVLLRLAAAFARPAAAVDDAARDGRRAGA